MEGQGYLKALDSSIRHLFLSVVRMALGRPWMLGIALKMLSHQLASQRRRTRRRKTGLIVPPFLIMSVTQRCNLSCAGCYFREQGRKPRLELGAERIDATFDEARDLGVSSVILAGGEPLLRPEIFDLTGKYPEIAFLVFTNGQLMDEAFLPVFKKQRHIVPVLSLEGDRASTDLRRGSGAFGKLSEVFANLNKNKIFFGVSLTVSTSNLNQIMDDDFIKRLNEKGAGLFFFLEYVPVKEGTEEEALSDEQREELLSFMAKCQKAFSAIFIAFPGSEEKFGGCLSAGRGFIHVGPDGSIEPCPLAPYSKENISNMTLKEALQSKFLKRIRENRAILVETQGGCALWDNREWVKGLLRQEKSASLEEPQLT